MKKLLYIPAFLFALNSLLSMAMFIAYSWGWGIERNAGEAALAAIFAVSGSFASGLMLRLAK